MAEREFVIEELTSGIDGVRDRAGVRFVWNAATQTAPRGSWEMPMTLRTVRTDYPGADRPTEQVLGWSFEPFTLSGEWQDQHAGAGFAQKTRTAFEQMFQRGNVVRIRFEKIVIYGLITQYTPTYYNAHRCGYEFTVSPHTRREPTLDGRRPRMDAPAPKSPAEHHRLLLEATNQAIALNATAPGFVLEEDWATIVGDYLAGWLADLAVVSNAIDAVLGPIEQAVEAMSRVAQTFAYVRGSASELVFRLAILRSDTEAAFEGIESSLAFDVWVKNTARLGRQMVLRAGDAERDARRHVKPEAKALYAPHKGESLYGISQRFYGTPHKWRAIASRNGLRSPFALTGTELLAIPREAG